MRKIILIFIWTILLSVFSCQKEGAQLKTDLSGTHISISDLKSYFPDKLLQNDTKIRYINSAGEELYLVVTFNEVVNMRTEYDRTYTYEQFAVGLNGVDDPNFVISIGGHALYDEKGNIQKTVSASLMPITFNNYATLNIFFNNGKPEISSGTLYFKSIEFNGDAFKQVFGAKKYNSDEPYSELWVNSNEGIVAFKDHRNVLWVFDGYVK